MNITKRYNKFKVQLSPVDLNKCRKGDILISCHGNKMTYVEKSDSPLKANFPHIVQYEGDGGQGSRTDDGFVYSRPLARLHSDHNIVAVLHLPRK